MASYDEEIRVAIIATAEGVQAGTDQASAAFAEFDAKVKASQAAAAAAYTESQQAFVAAQTQAAEVLADRIMDTITKYSGGVRDGDPAMRLEALGRAVGDSCGITLSLLAAIAAPHKGTGDYST